MTDEPQGNHRLIHGITPRNILSYGPGTPALPLGNLNVLIGPNGSGKSNLIEVLSLLRAAPGDLRAVVRQGGGAQEWIWKGNPDSTASVDVVVANPEGRMPLRHVLTFRAAKQGMALDDERIENADPYPDKSEPYFYYRYQQGHPVAKVAGSERSLTRETVEPDKSILAQRRDPDSYPVITYLADVYEQVRVYREWTFGRNAIFREPQKADMRNDRLEEDFANLGLFLNRLRRTPRAKQAILERVRDLYEGLSDYDISIEGGTVQVFFTEGEFTIPATRLSDGTVRYLCLLAILCDPAPPRLICIEEPELGLHPDLLPKLADLLVEASARTQLVVTTHSDTLIDALSEHPEAVLVCEKHDGRTEVRRLGADHLAPWLEKYRLGELWTRGELGGTRW